MLLLTAAKAASAAIAGALTVTSGRNMLQTYQIAHAHDVTLPQHTKHHPQHMSGARPAPVRYLQSLSRAELLRLYLHDGCEVPSSPAAFLDGEWNGVLLNNGPVLTRVVTFITNQLFGKRRRWNGKAFDTSTGCGHNQFVRLQQSKTQAPRGMGTSTTTTTTTTTTSVLVVARTEDDQKFDFAIRESRLGTGPALVLDYTNGAQRQNHHSASRPFWSPWRYMVDEIRIVPLNITSTAWNNALVGDDKNKEWEVLLGWGSMGWSGGSLNSSPFCLYRRLRKKRSTS